MCFFTKREELAGISGNIKGRTNPFKWGFSAWRRDAILLFGVVCSKVFMRATEGDWASICPYENWPRKTEKNVLAKNLICLREYAGQGMLERICWKNIQERICWRKYAGKSIPDRVYFTKYGKKYAGKGMRAMP